MTNNSDHILDMMLSDPAACRRVLEVLIDQGRIKMSQNLDVFGDDQMPIIFEKIWRMLEADDTHVRIEFTTDLELFH